MPPDKKPEPAAKLSLFGHPDPFVEFVFIILFILVLVYFFNSLLSLITTNIISVDGVWFRLVEFFVGNSLGVWIWRLILVAFSIVLLVLTIDTHRKLVILRKQDKEALYPDIVPSVEPVNAQWKRIVDHAESTNENDWRQAIIEADIMLAGVLEQMNLPGDSIGEKLKAVDRSDFTTMDSAWQAHKVRNQIAHEGAGFILTQRQVRETIAQYEAVFKEFKLI